MATVTPNQFPTSVTLGDGEVLGEVQCKLTPEDLAKGVDGDVFEDVIALAREGYEKSGSPTRYPDHRFLEIMCDAEARRRAFAGESARIEAPARIAQVRFFPSFGRCAAIAALFALTMAASVAGMRFGHVVGQHLAWELIFAR